ncbi:MAG: GAF domain-containing protein [Chloroflexi bacterium]|nr:GAF domain-containing protein [Chloroflexota bacterium]
MDNPLDERIPQYIEATERLKEGQYDIELPPTPPDEIGRLGSALQALAQTLEARYREIQKLNQITSRINAGLLLDEILEGVYRDFREFIPYNRIGFSLIEDEGRVVRARWAKTDQLIVKLGRGYSAPLAGSSLQTIIETKKPRIINDLVDYLEKKPTSGSTRLVVEEGIRSSLTCPLIANGVPVGFMFFSSVEPNIYADAHVEIFQRIAEQLSVIVEKGRMVSELATQKESIERQNEELRHLNELKNSFLGIAAHDLRNPLANIQLASELLIDMKASLSDEERDQFLQEMNQHTHYMLALLNDLLDVTHIESGKLSLTPVAVNVADFLNDLVKRHAKLAEPKQTRVILEPAPAGNVNADPLRLRQVMDNLISNAVKYSPPGSEVRVRVIREATLWRFEIQDQGPGITPEDRAKMFQDFARLSARPTGGEKSTGLGLAITRRVIEAHRGKIGVESEVGKGSIFWFTLPHEV